MKKKTQFNPRICFFETQHLTYDAQAIIVMIFDRLILTGGRDRATIMCDDAVEFHNGVSTLLKLGYVDNVKLRSKGILMSLTCTPKLWALKQKVIRTNLRKEHS